MLLTILLAQLLAGAAHEVAAARRAPAAAARARAALASRPPRDDHGPPRARLSRPRRRVPSSAPMQAPDGIPGSVLTGPYPVGQYAAALRERLRGFARVQVFGEVFGFKTGRAKVWFELRDAAGALPCSMWREDFEQLRLGALADGMQVVVAGGCDYYPGSRTASPAFSFTVTRLRVAGEGDLLAQLEQLRRRLASEGLFEPQKALLRPALPRCIGVVTGESGKARDDVLAGLRRRGWAGRIVWAFAPVQDRHAAPAITRALQDLAACAGVEVIVVARGGGALADLFAFCDETLCRTVALLPVPGDLVRRPPHGPHAARRRRRGRLLDADARGGDRRAGGLRRGPRGCRGRRRPAGAPRPPRGAGARPRARAAVARAGASRRAPPRAAAPAAARAARGDAPRGGGRRALDARTGGRPRAPVRGRGAGRHGARSRRRRGTGTRGVARGPPSRPRAAGGHARRARPAADARAGVRAGRGLVRGAGGECRGGAGRARRAVLGRAGRGSRRAGRRRTSTPAVKGVGAPSPRPG